MELLTTRSTIADPAAPRALAAAPGGSGLRLDGVVFRYPSRPATPALDGVAGREG